MDGPQRKRSAPILLQEASGTVEEVVCSLGVRWQSRLLCRSVEEALFVCSEVSSCARRDGRYRRAYDRFCVLERGSVIIPVFSGSLSRNISLQEKTGMSPLCVKVGLPPSSVID